MMILLSALFLVTTPTLDEGVRRVQANLLIGDPAGAVTEAEKVYSAYPETLEAGTALIEAHAAAGSQDVALDQWDRLSVKYPMIIQDRNLLEAISWGVLRKELRSTQYNIRLAALIGAYLTKDAKAIPVLLQMMRDSNAVIRSVAVQMCATYGDAPLKAEIERMMTEEKVWIVRLEVIKAAGMLQMKSLAPKLQALVQSDQTMLEERHMAIASLLAMTDQVDMADLTKLAKSNRAGLRHLACAIAMHFQEMRAKDLMLGLLGDSNPDVRVAALNALGLVYRQEMTPADVKEALRLRLEETDPKVAITAAWVAMLHNPKYGTPYFEKWLSDPFAENRRLAAAALAATGNRGVELASDTLRKNEDPYVRANVAMGLIGQRHEVKASCDSLVQFLTNEKKMWMWDNRPNPLFQILSPSQVRHVDQIPNYPEAIDQMTRLKIVSMLAMVDDPRAIDALKSFLQLKKWHITGVAAATLLHEGDEGSLELVRALIDDPDPQVRLQACLVLAMYGKEESVLKVLQGAYSGADFEMKLHILEALGAIGSTDSYSLFMSALREPFPLLRVASAAALIQSIYR